MANTSFLQPHDKILTLINDEQIRQQTTLNFIASENYVSRPIRAAVGSILTNKYAEGYPAKRYYAGCEVVDRIETIAINNAKQLFKADHANVQPHAGSQANFAAYQALIKPGATILGMSLAHGGHLTHGHPVNLSGSWYNAISYEVNPESELLDYDEIERLAYKHKPALIIAGASSYSRTINFLKFAEIAHAVGAFFLADMAHIAGLVAAELHPSPIPHADIVTSTTHKTLRGPRGGLILSSQKHSEAVDRAIMPGMQGGPFMHVIAGKAMCFNEAMQPDFVPYQLSVISLATHMANCFIKKGYRIVAGGTDNHMFVVDLHSTAHSGRSAETLLEQAGITVSRSCIPNDPRKPWLTSGIRFGTPAMATRGMTSQQTEEIVEYVHELLTSSNAEEMVQKLQPKIRALAESLICLR
jgi:glycine hydroxymethyltransferase